VRSGQANGTSEKIAMHGMHNGLKSVVRTQLAVSVVEMVAERLQADPKFPGDFGRILAI
jgi:hypothetical protein